LIDAATKEGLPIKGIVADVATYSPDGHFDVIVIDRTLHMLDEGPRLDTLVKLLDCVATDGWVLIEDERTNIAGFKAAIEGHNARWKMLQEKRSTLFIRRD
jgi:tellurite methyltransferase